MLNIGSMIVTCAEYVSSIFCQKSTDSSSSDNMTRVILPRQLAQLPISHKYLQYHLRLP